MMCATDKLFLMLDDEHRYGQLVSGAEPSVAVEAHYASLDAWCAPAPDAEISEEFLVFLYEVPPHLTDDVSQQFEDMSGDRSLSNSLNFYEKTRKMLLLKSM